MAKRIDPLKEHDKLTPAGDALVTSREKILEVWAARVREKNPSATHLLQPILINTMPPFIDSIAECLNPELPGGWASSIAVMAQEHGSERARLTSYDLNQVIAEYQVLRLAIFEQIDDEIDLTATERAVIHSCIDAAIRTSATSFVLVQSDVREQFVATLSHDLRNPLTSASMAAELILRDRGNQDVKLLAAKILENHQRIDRMIRDLLDVTLVRTGGRLPLQIAECDMLAIVSEVASHVKLTHGRDTEVIGEAAKGFWDADALRRAIENLASNAVKYGSDHSCIRFGVRFSNDRVIVTVHNEGPPIPIDEQESIFQVYRRSPSAAKGGKRGWGIGLALVRGVAESHGGSMGLDSSPGRGTTFAIDVPLDSRPFLETPVLG